MRLIDADALLSAFENEVSKQDKYMELFKSMGDMERYFNISRMQTGMISFLRMLNEAPTIIPAEKVKEAVE